MPQNPIFFGGIVSPQSLRAASFSQAGMTWFANASIGSDTKFGGVSRGTPFATIGKAIAVASPGDVIMVAPGTYNETVTVPRALSNLTIVGLGTRGDVLIQPSATNANALVNNADQVCLQNLRVNANGTGVGVVNTGSRFQAFGSKFENTDGTGTACQLTLASANPDPSGVQGNGADVMFDDVEFAWAATGLLLTGNNGLAVTQIRVSNSRFHNLATAHVAESTLNSGPAADAWRNLEMWDNVHDRNEDGSEPTNYLLLNASNSNTGIVTRCSFPTAIAGGKNLVSTALHWTSNYMTGGISAAQPS